ncbi:hypothetical protein JW887_05045 [Candidatus Dojkabacteria bacterium]|nr:hypothetical protein [Candidatus Dojkabacteria bacterium]
MKKTLKENNKISYSREDKSKTEIVYEIEIDFAEYKTQYQKELKKLQKNFRIKGFRPGKAPADMVEMSEGKEANGKAMSELMPKVTTSVLKEESVTPVAPVSYEIVTFEKDKPIVYKASIAILPEFKVPDLRPILKKVKKEDSSVKDSEIESVLKQLWQDKSKKGDHKNMDDEWVKDVSKTIGFKSTDMNSFKQEIKDSIKVQKDRVVEDNYQHHLLHEAITLSKIDIPEALIKYEAAERERSFNQQLKQMNVSSDQFCKIRGVTMEQLRDQWLGDSKEALEHDVFLLSYAKDRKVEVSEPELQSEIDLIKAQNKNAKPDVYEDSYWRSYIKRIVMKRKSYSNFLKELGISVADTNEKKGKSE